MKGGRYWRRFGHYFCQLKPRNPKPLVGKAGDGGVNVKAQRIAGVKPPLELRQKAIDLKQGLDCLLGLEFRV